MQQKSIEVQLSDGSIGYAVTPKEDCPHFSVENLKEAIKNCIKFGDQLFQKPCNDCGDKSENWICISCSIICCSREIKGHMLEHNKQTQHPIVLSLSDISFWCYECESYITNFILGQSARFLSKKKFKEESQDDSLESLNEQMSNLNIDQKFTYEELISGLKSKKFQNICVLAGAGMSVAAGIPDFRTPGTGLYSKLEKFNLPYPEIIFDIQFFKQKPLAFYQVAKEFLLTFDAKPTLAHHLLKLLDSRNQLKMCYTQNIDGLELDAGVTPEKVIQAHGHMRSAHCLQCKTEAPIKDFMENIKNDKIHKCSKCGVGLIKPDVVFFGEGLPESYFHNIDKIKQADLVLVIGTSLKVMPFALSVTLIPKNTPIVLLNREDVLQKNNVLHLEGDIEENCQKILNDLK